MWDSFWFAEGAPENTVIWVVDPRKSTRTELFDTPRLRKAVAEKLGEEPPGAGLPFAAIELVDDEGRARFVVAGRTLVIDLESYAIEEEPPPSDEEKARRKRMEPLSFKFLLGNMTQELLSPDEMWFAGIENSNIYLRSTEDDSRTFLTDDGEDLRPWDLWNASPQWSPDSRLLAVTRVD